MGNLPRLIGTIRGYQGPIGDYLWPQAPSMALLVNWAQATLGRLVEDNIRTQLSICNMSTRTRCKDMEAQVCTILYYTILYYTILYYTILYYTILYYTILYYTILYYTILYYTILYYTILYYTILYYTILYYTVLYYTTPYYTIPYYNSISILKLGTLEPFLRAPGPVCRDRHPGLQVV